MPRFLSKDFIHFMRQCGCGILGGNIKDFGHISVGTLNLSALWRVEPSLSSSSFAQQRAPPTMSDLSPMISCCCMYALGGFTRSQRSTTSGDGQLQTTMTSYTNLHLVELPIVYIPDVTPVLNLDGNAAFS